MSQYYTKCIPSRMYPMGLKAVPYQQELTYLESTGSQYIDTGFSGYSDGCTVELDILVERPSQGNDWHCFGIRNNANGSWRNGVNIVAGYSSMFSFSGMGSQAITSDYTSYGTRMLVKVNYDKDSLTYKSYFNGTLKTDSSLYAADFADLGTLLLFAARQVYYDSGTLMGIYRSKMKCCACRIWNASGSLCRSFIPVLDNSGVPCMYDKVTHAFFYNQGTGTFNYE